MPILFPVIVGEGAASLDTALVTELMNLVKTVMGLFSEFPLNFLLIASLATMAFAIFRSAKRAAR